MLEVGLIHGVPLGEGRGDEGQRVQPPEVDNARARLVEEGVPEDVCNGRVHLVWRESDQLDGGVDGPGVRVGTAR